MITSKHEKTYLFQSPFVYVSPSFRTMLLAIIAVLLPQVFMLFFTKSYSALLVILAAVSASCLAEFLYGLKKACSVVSVLVAFFQGLVVGFLLPESYPPAAVFLVTFCSMFIGKYAFAGFAASWANPVALSVAIAYILYATPFPTFLTGVSVLSERNAALSLMQRGVLQVSPFDSAITDFINRNVFVHFGMEIPDGYVSLFWDSGSPIPAFRFNVLTLLASLFLFSSEIVGCLIPAVFAFTYSALIHFVPLSYFVGTQVYGDILLAFLSSGVLFSTLFVLQWYGTVPFTVWGKLMYGVVAGLMAYIIMGYGTSSVGYVFVILIMNFISVFIQNLEMRSMKSFFKKSIKPRLEALKEVQAL